MSKSSHSALFMFYTACLLFSLFGLYGGVLCFCRNKTNRKKKSPAPLLCMRTLHTNTRRKRGRQVEKHADQTERSGEETEKDIRTQSCLHTKMAHNNARVTTLIHTCHKALITSGSAFLGRQLNYHSAATKHTLDS